MIPQVVDQATLRVCHEGANDQDPQHFRLDDKTRHSRRLVKLVSTRYSHLSLVADESHLEQPLLKRPHGADIVEQTVAALFYLPHQRCAPSLVGNKRNRKL